MVNNGSFPDTSNNTLDIKNRDGQEVRYIEIDLSNEASIAAAVAQFDGKADALCNIAGVPPTVSPLLVLQVNVVGRPFFTQKPIALKIDA